MMVARYRALTLFSKHIRDVWRVVEMMVARYRALTRCELRPSKRVPFRRNDSCPLEGIDTSIVERTVLEARPL